MNAQAKSDPYLRLRPEPPTTEEDICRCADRPPIILQDHLSSVPLACLKCNLEVPPERIGFNEQIAENMAHWRGLRRGLYLLWLDSADYEEWAARQLQDPQGRVNVCGIEIVQELNGYRRAYYRWFEDASVEDFAPPSKCPRCSRPVVRRLGSTVCEECSVLVHGRD